MPVGRMGETPMLRDTMTEPANMNEQLSAYLDGELSAAEAQGVEAAVAADAALARELERLRAAREFVRRLPREQAPDDFAMRVMAQAERAALLWQTPAQPPTRRWLRPSTVAAAAMLVLAAALAAGIVLYPSLFSQQPSRRVTTNSPATQPAAVLSWNKSHEADLAEPLEREPLAMARNAYPGDVTKDLRSGSDAKAEAKQWPEEFADIQDMPATFPFDDRASTPSVTMRSGGKPATNAFTQIIDGGTVEVAIVNPHEADGNTNRINEKQALDKQAAERLADSLFEHDADIAESESDADVMETLGDALAMLISTDNVAQTREHVEKIFADNGAVRLAALPLDAPSLPPGIEQNLSNHKQYSNTMLQRSRTGESPVDVVVVQAYATPAQAQAIAKDLDELRRAQPTPQRPIEETRDRHDHYLAWASMNYRFQNQLRAENLSRNQSQFQAQEMDESNAFARLGIHDGDALNQAAMNPLALNNTRHSQADQQASRGKLSDDDSAAPPTPIEAPKSQSVPATTQPADNQLQRVLVTVEYRPLPRAAVTTRPANEATSQETK